MRNLTEGGHVSIDAPWEGGRTRVGMLPEGLGVRARASWASSRVFRWMQLRKWRIAAMLATIAALAFVAVEVAPDAFRAPEPARKAPIATGKRKAKPVAKKKSSVVQTSAASKPADDGWVSAPAENDYLATGHILMKAGRIADAEDAYRKALAADRDDGDARFWLATAESSQGKNWRACRHFKKYLENFPKGRYASDARMNAKKCD